MSVSLVSDFLEALGIGSSLLAFVWSSEAALLSVEDLVGADAASMSVAADWERTEGLLSFTGGGDLFSGGEELRLGIGADKKSSVALVSTVVSGKTDVVVCDAGSSPRTLLRSSEADVLRGRDSVVADLEALSSIELDDCK